MSQRLHVSKASNNFTEQNGGKATKSRKIKEKIVKIENARKIIQFGFFLLFTGVIFGLEPSSILLPIPVTLGSPQKIAGDAFSAMQYMLYQVVFPWLPIASFLIIVMLSGRLLCGWACPFGFIQDILGYVKKKHKEISLETHRTLIYGKYIILGITLFFSITLSVSLAAGAGTKYKQSLGIFGEAPFDVLSPVNTLFASIPKMMIDFRYTIMEESFWKALEAIGAISALFWIRFAILLIILVLAVYIPRVWCKYLCPHAAIQALINRFSFLGLKREPVKCTKADCKLCMEACPMNVRILELPWEKFTDPECIYCLKCRDACPTKAIKPKIP
jgi:polyferredoxin